MKKLVLLVFALTTITLASQAQLNVNINIGSQPAYVPVHYTTSSYYYAPARPVYVNRVVKVKPRKHYYSNTRSYYANRPVVYREVHYKKFKGNDKHRHYKGKGRNRR